MTTKVGTFTDGTFDVQNPTPAQQAAMLTQAQALASSAFNLVLLASMHVHDDGSLFFNNTPMINSNPAQPSGELSPNLSQCLDAIRSNGATILASFGGGGMIRGNAVGYWDFSAIQTLIGKYPDPAANPFFQNLACMFATYPQIQGIDIDLETYTGYDQFTATVVAVVRWVVAQGRIVTLCPFEEPDFWVNVVAQTTGNGKPQIAWVNVQNAEGTLSQFVGPMQRVGIGVDALVGGLQLGPDMAPDITQTFGQITRNHPGIGGGWLWNLEQYGTDNMASYASTLATALEVKS